MEKETTNTQTTGTMEQPKTPIYKKIPWRKVGEGLAVIGTTFLAGFLGAKYGAASEINQSVIDVHMPDDYSLPEGTTNDNE